MDLIPIVLGVAGGIGALVFAIFAKIAADDLKEVAPLFTQKIFNSAVRNLPESKRERYTEEWSAHLSEVQGIIGKVVFVLHLNLAGLKIRELDANERLNTFQFEYDTLISDLRSFPRKIDFVRNASQHLRESGDDQSLEDIIADLEKKVVALSEFSSRFEGFAPSLGLTMARVRFVSDRLRKKRVTDPFDIYLYLMMTSAFGKIRSK